MKATTLETQSAAAADTGIETIRDHTAEGGLALDGFPGRFLRNPAKAGKGSDAYDYFKPDAVEPSYLLTVLASGAILCSCPAAAKRPEILCKHAAALADALAIANPSPAGPSAESDGGDAETAGPTGYIVVGDMAVDPSTGECYGAVDKDGRLLTETEVKSRFTVRDKPTLEWLMGKLFAAQGHERDLEVRIANLNLQLKARKNVRKRLMEYFGADAQAVVAELTAGTKVRSIPSDKGCGRIGLRANPGSIRVLDSAAAVEWASANMPDALRVETTVLTTPLKGFEDDLPADIFAVEDPHDNLSYSDGRPKPTAADVSLSEDGGGALDGRMW